MKTSVLVGPKYGSSTVLNESEYEMLANVLRLHRSDNQEANALCGALEDTTDNMVNRRTDGNVLAYFLETLAQRLGSHAEEIQGLIVEPGVTPTYLREEEGKRHLECVKALLKILHTGGWFANYLEVRLANFAKKSPQPLDVMESLSEPACNFECDIDDAKELMHRWPQLFAQGAGNSSKSDLSHLAKAV